MSESRNTDIINRWFAERYGSRKGALLTFWYWTLNMLGKYRPYRHIDWDRVERLVFVCSGNICRSAYAEAVARSIGIDSASCGIDTVKGAPANEEAVRTAATRGFDLSEHKTTPIQTQTIRKSDLLIAMEPWQAVYLLQEFPAGQCSLLGLWGSPVIPYIHDPYGYSSAYFETCFGNIENSVYGISEKLL